MAEHVELIRSTLGNIAPLSVLSAEELEELATQCRIIEISARDFLFIEGDAASAAYCVVEGRMVMLKSSRNGKELIVQLLPPGELLGLVAFLDRKPFPLSARAQCNSKVLAIPTQAVSPLLTRHPELMRRFAELVAQRMRETQDLARALAHDRIETRIASVLLSLIPRLGSESPHAALEIPLGRQELADVVGTTIETASRVMKAFERERIVDLSRTGIVVILDRSPLQSLIESPGTL